MFNTYNRQNTHVLGSVTSDFQVKKLDLERLIQAELELKSL